MTPFKNNDYLKKKYKVSEENSLSNNIYTLFLFYYCTFLYLLYFKNLKNRTG